MLVGGMVYRITPPMRRHARLWARCLVGEIGREIFAVDPASHAILAMLGLQTDERLLLQAPFTLQVPVVDGVIVADSSPGIVYLPPHVWHDLEQPQSEVGASTAEADLVIPAANCIKCMAPIGGIAFGYHVLREGPVTKIVVGGQHVQRIVCLRLVNAPYRDAVEFFVCFDVCAQEVGIWNTIVLHEDENGGAGKECTDVARQVCARVDIQTDIDIDMLLNRACIDLRRTIAYKNKLELVGISGFESSKTCRGVQVAPVRNDYRRCPGIMDSPAALNRLKNRSIERRFATPPLFCKGGVKLLGLVEIKSFGTPDMRVRQARIRLLSAFIIVEQQNAYTFACDMLVSYIISTDVAM